MIPLPMEETIDHIDGTDDIFTFGVSSQYEERKNHRQVIEGFLEAFGNSKKVRLLVHGRWGHTHEALAREFGHHKNIHITIGKLIEQEYDKWWSRLHAYILVSAGEGFSYSPREAILRNIPTIVSNCTAHEILVNTGGVIGVEPIGMEPAYKHLLGRAIGNHYTITSEDTALAMIKMKKEYPIWKKNVLKAKKYIADNESHKEVGRLWTSLILKGT